MKISKLIIICFLFSNCADYNTQTKILNNYLKEKFGEEIPMQVHYYIIIGAYACKGCVYETVKSIPKIKKDIPLTIITSYTAPYIDGIDSTFMEKIKHLPNIKYDYSGKLERLNLNLATPIMIKTENRRVKLSQNINMENFKEIFNLSE